MDSALRLQVIADSGNMARLESESRRALQENPEDTTAHYFLAVALIGQSRPREARGSVDFLLQREPEEMETLVAAIMLEQSLGKRRAVMRHAAEGRRLYPYVAYFPYVMAGTEAGELRFKKAKTHIDAARELDPNDADIVDLALRIDGILRQSTTVAWERVAEYQSALRLDPESASLHEGIADVYLDDLNDARAAESHLREAVRLQPDNPGLQHKLFVAVGKRDLIYRVFGLPSRAFEWLRGVAFGIRKRPLYLLLMLVGYKFVLLFFAWLVAATVAFWPAGKVYEWMLISEICKGAKASHGGMRWWFRFQRWPRALRFGFFLAFLGACWGLLFALLGVPLKTGYLALGGFTVVHFAVSALFAGVHALRSRWGRWRARRSGAAVPGEVPPTN